MADGLFGPTPWEVRQMQQQQIGQQADKYASQDPFQRAAAGMYRAGGGLAAPVAGMFGLENVDQANAARTQEVLRRGSADMTTSKGYYDKAEQFRQAGDMRTAMALFSKGKELEKQEMQAANETRKAALAERKQEFTEQESMDFKRKQLEQQFEIAKMRSEDSRLASADRVAAMREANQIRLMIAQMARENKGGVTPAQQMKQQKQNVDDIANIRNLETSFANISSTAEQIKQHPGLGGATGITGAVPSIPGGKSAQAEALIGELKSMTKQIGLELARAGGSIGQITEKEWGIVEGMVANIDPVRLGKQGTIDQINKVVAKAQQTLSNAKAKYVDMYGQEPSVQSTPPPTTTGRSGQFRVLGKE